MQKVKICVRCIQRKTVPKPSAELVNILTTEHMDWFVKILFRWKDLRAVTNTF